MATSIDLDPARQLASAEDDLAAEFPSVAPEEIHSRVEDENDRYDAASVRDYISILVARTVRTELLAHSPSVRVEGHSRLR